MEARNRLWIVDALAHRGAESGEPSFVRPTPIRSSIALTACVGFASLAAGCGLVLDLDPEVDDRLDARVRDAQIADARPADAPPEDACGARAEDCNGADDDCDGLVDEGFDLMTDPRHCGACDIACPPGSSTCAAGACQSACPPATGDCDDDPANGCETDLTTSIDCGACGRVCSATSPRCAPGADGYACMAACSTTTTACGGACVDTATDEANCGSCGILCPTDEHGRIECVEGICRVLDCGDGYRDCNGEVRDGCETFVRTSTLNCGSCAVACNDGEDCVGGACVATP